MTIAALLFAAFCLYVMVNRRTRARGFEPGTLHITRVQTWATHGGESTATTSNSYKVHGTVTTPQGDYPATSIDVYGESVRAKEGRTVPCRYDPENPGRVTLNRSDVRGLDSQDAMLLVAMVACLAFAWFTR